MLGVLVSALATCALVGAVLVAHDDWRAGSGLPGPYATKPCENVHRWLPDGTSSLRQFDDYAGTLIRGRSFRLSDKRCGDGTLRQETFSHTESAAGNRQCPNRSTEAPL